MKYFLYCLQHYVDFDGRARRSEFWYFVLFNLLFTALFTIIGNFIGFERLGNLASLVTFLPGLAVSVRRLHDVGKSGWFVLLVFVPLIQLYLLYLDVQDSQPGDNQYGPNPKTGAGNVQQY